jgi:hypothetical protein
MGYRSLSVIGDVRPNRSVLRTLGGRRLLFNEADQSIHEIDELTAFVWQSAELGLRSEDTVRDLMAAGVGADAAASAVDAATKQLQAIQSAPQPVGEQTPKQGKILGESARAEAADLGLVLFTAEIPGIMVVRAYLTRDLLTELLPVLGYLQKDKAQADCEILVRTVGDAIEFVRPDHSAWQCSRAEFVAAFKAELLEQVLRHANYEVALHTAALVRDERAILIVGQPGAGKSTLAFALARNGWEMAADDVVLLDQRGRVTGLQFPLTAKAGAWPLLGRHWPECILGPAYRRPDDIDVRFILPEALAAPKPFEIAAFVLVDRRPEVNASLEPVEPTQMLAILLGEATSADQRLTGPGFTSLVSALGNARCVRLVYGDLLEGAAALDELQQ